MSSSPIAANSIASSGFQHPLIIIFAKVSSEFFWTNWTAENLSGGDDEYVCWAGEIKIKDKLINALQKLDTIEYVTQQLPS